MIAPAPSAAVTAARAPGAPRAARCAVRISVSGAKNTIATVPSSAPARTVRSCHTATRPARAACRYGSDRPAGAGSRGSVNQVTAAAPSSSPAATHSEASAPTMPMPTPASADPTISPSSSTASPRALTSSIVLPPAAATSGRDDSRAAAPGPSNSAPSATRARVETRLNPRVRSSSGNAATAAALSRVRTRSDAAPTPAVDQGFAGDQRGHGRGEGHRPDQAGLGRAAGARQHQPRHQHGDHGVRGDRRAGCGEQSLQGAAVRPGRGGGEEGGHRGRIPSNTVSRTSAGAARGARRPSAIASQAA